MKKIIVILFMITLSASASYGLSLLESRFYGTPNHIHTARSLGMGGCSIAQNNGAAGLFANPASIALTQNIHFMGNINVTRFGEEISRKVYDEFDNTIGDAVYASNTNYYIQPSLMGAILPLSQFGLPMINVGFGYSLNYDHGYDYNETFYDNSYVKDIEIDYQMEGITNDYAFGLSVQPHKVINIGLSLHYLNGERKREWKKIDYQDPANTAQWSDDISDISGLQFGYGAIFQPLNFAKRLTIGVYGKSSTTLEGDYITDISKDTREITYPSEFGFGINYMPMNEIPSALSLDVIFTQWENLEDKIADDVLEYVDLDNTVEVHLGVEHVLIGNFPVRAGFFFTPMYINKEISNINFTLGGGYNIQKFNIDLAGTVGKRAFYAKDINPDFWNNSYLPLEIPNTSKIDETVVRFATTVRYEL